MNTTGCGKPCDSGTGHIVGRGTCEDRAPDSLGRRRPDRPSAEKSFRTVGLTNLNTGPRELRQDRGQPTRLNHPVGVPTEEGSRCYVSFNAVVSALDTATPAWLTRTSGGPGWGHWDMGLHRVEDGPQEKFPWQHCSRFVSARQVRRSAIRKAR